MSVKALPSLGKEVTIDLVSDSEDDDENIQKNPPRLVNRPPPVAPVSFPPPHRNQDSQQQHKSPPSASVAEVTVEGPSTPMGPSVGAGHPPKVVEWSRCLVCNKGFLSMCRRAGEGAEVVGQVSYLLEQCMGVPPRKCKKVAKKILQESEGDGGRGAVSLFCPTHESMVVDANELSLKVTKLVEDLEVKEETLRSVAGKWISGDEPVDGMGQIVRNAVMRANRKNENTSNASKEEEPVDLKHSLPQLSQPPGSAVNNGPKSVSTQPPLKDSNNEPGSSSKEVKPAPRTPPRAVPPKNSAMKQGNTIEQQTSAVGNNGVERKRRTGCGANGHVEPEAQKLKTSPVKNAKDTTDVVVVSIDSEEDEDVEVKVLPLPESLRVPSSSSSSSRRLPSAAVTPNSSDQIKAGLGNNRNLPYPCNESIESVITSSRLLWGSKPASTNGAKECPVCPELFYTATERNKHYRSVHGDGIHFVCFICKRLNSTFHNLKTHLTNLHDPAKPFACDKCGIRHGTKVRLEAHIQTHLRQTNTRCHSNQSAVRAKPNFSASKKLVNNSIISQNYRNQQQRQQQPKFKTCTYCRKRVPDSKSLQFHVETHHRINCNKCSFRCDSEKVLRMHIAKRHREPEDKRTAKSEDFPPASSTTRRPRSHRDIRDQKCDRKFNRESIFFHDCDNCGLDFDTRGELMRHKRDCRPYL